MFKQPEKYPRTFHWPWSETVHSDDRTLSIEMAESFVGNEVIVTEKLDGQNACLYHGNVFARSVQLPASDGWFAMVKKHHVWKTYTGADDLMFYGEDLYGIHSLTYDALDEGETFRLFAIRKGDEWLSWDEVQDLAKLYNFLTVPILYRGTFSSVNEITEFFHTGIKKPSIIGPTTEGFVIRLADEFNNDEFTAKVCKFVRANHVQTDDHWRKNWQPCAFKKK